MTPPTLKPGWKTVKFGDVVRQVKDKVDPKESGLKRYIAGEHMDTDDLHLRRWGDIGDGYLGPAFHMRFKPGQVLYGSRRTYLRKVAVADFEGITANTTYVLESKDPKELLPELLPFIMSTETFHEHSVQQSKGSVNPYINFSDIAWYEFSLPPLDEQRGIAKLLASVETTLNELFLLHSSSLQLKQSSCIHLFTFGVNSRRQMKKAKNQFGQMPIMWEEKPLIDVVEFLDSERIPLKSADRAERQGPYPYYGASGIIDHIDDYIFDEELLLLSEDGANLVDRNYPVAFIASGKYWVNNHAHVLRVAQDHSIHYLAEYLEAITYLPYITGTAQPKLNQQICHNIPVPIPPKSEEDEIASILVSLNQKSAEIDKRKNHLMKLKSTLLTSNLEDIH